MLCYIYSKAIIKISIIKLRIYRMGRLINVYLVIPLSGLVSYSYFFISIFLLLHFLSYFLFLGLV